MSPSQAQATETYEYSIGVGDVLTIRVLGEEDFSGQFRVANDGTIDYPYIRRIDVREKSPKEMGDQIATLLKDGYLADPHVMVEVKEYHSQKVLVLGAVTKPGTYVLTENTRVLDLISRAGGITPAGGKRILLLRDWEGEAKGAEPNSSKSKATEMAETPKETTADELARQVGTELNGEKKEEPRVTPEVTQTKIQTDPEASTKETQKPQASEELDKVLVLAATKAKPKVIDYHRLVSKGDLTENYRLKNGDILNIPKANEIFIFGSVTKPGPIKYEDGLTILQALTLAGGPTPEASTKSTYILRETDQGEEKLEVRLDKIIDNKIKNVPLKANDVMVIPESFF